MGGKQSGEEIESKRSEDTVPPLETLFRDLDTTREGLADDEARNRLGTYGYNEIEEKRTNPVLRLLGYFWGPIPWMIEAAAALSALVGDWTDFSIILVLLLMNAGVGFWEEFQADNAVDALKKQLALKARVRRNGAWTNVESRELVPGDVIRIRNGDVIPADAVLLDEDPVKVDESALTGESLPVQKMADQRIFSGATVKQGESAALVTATGGNTYFGRTAALVGEAGGASHFQKAILKIGDYLILLAIGLVILILAAALYRHDGVLTVLRFCLVLTVAAIPVAMPTVLSVTLAVGARLLSSKQAIVRRLAAIEEIAGVDILCSDKTGTLTKNKLTLGEPVVIKAASADEVILAAALSSREENQDPIDLAVLEGLSDPSHAHGYSILHFDPFDSVRKRTEATVESQDGSQYKVTKGAPQVILSLLKSPGDVEAKVRDTIDDLAKRGYRSLGVARTRQDGSDWEYLGILPLHDPPREDSKPTIERARAMGVAVKMVTGDQRAIALETARQLGLGTNILDASRFEDVKYHEAARVEEEIEKADGFAEVYPEHKYHIVEVLRKRGHIVGMTGDGVNDAPALKKADAGIAVSGATDAARSAASIVLLSPGLSVIVDALRESRKIFQRMTSYAIYRITETIRILLFMTLSILLFNVYPVTAVMIVLLALLNDGAILSIAYDNVKGSDRPVSWNMPQVLGMATLLGSIGVVETFGLFYLGKRHFHLDPGTLQTLIYLKLSVAGHLTVFVARTKGPFWSRSPSKTLFGAVVLTQIIATLIAVYGLFMTPLGWKWAGVVWAYCLVWLFIEDATKLVAYHMFDHEWPVLLRRSKATS